MMDTRVMIAHIPLPLAEKVDAMADRLDRSRGWIIKQALAAWLADEEERYQMTLDGLADIDAGRVVDHAIVHAWIASLGTDNPLPLIGSSSQMLTCVKRTAERTP